MKLFQVDSFTKEKFKGNPAAVCLVERDLTEDEMQNIALEMNLSETAFVRAYSRHCNLRWFTPTSEVPLCGHATLAAAYVLWNEGLWPKDQTIEFSTLSGSLFTSLNDNESISMDFPARKPETDHLFDKMPLEVEMGGAILEVLRIPGELILIMEDPKAVIKANPNSDYLSEQAKNGVMISAQSTKGDYDFVSRYFAPNLGIKEDPVTGYMHTILTPYWSEKLSKKKFKAYQASHRGGHMSTELKKDRVVLTGDAVKVFETEI